jgi:hypothetical protein
LPALRCWLHEWIYHDGDHLKQIMTAVQGFV